MGMNVLPDRGNDRFCLTLSRQFGLVNLECVYCFGFTFSCKACDLLGQNRHTFTLEVF